MKKYAKPTANNRYYSNYRFTAHKMYEVINDYGSRVDICDDNGNLVTVRVDGARSGRLDAGLFKIEYAHELKVNTQHVREIVANASESTKVAREIEDIEKIREILRCPKGESILEHARTIRVIADLTLARLNQK